MAATPAFASFEQEWLDAHPEYAIASIFLPPAQRRRENAFAVLVHELGAAARLHEPQVATAKLSWWRGELTGAVSGRSSHPIARELFADAGVSNVDPALWLALADAALAQHGNTAAATLPELLGQRGAFHGVVARIESAMSGGTNADVESNATLWTITQLLRELPQLEHADDNLPLPLDLLARHGVTRSGLSAPTAQRTALLRDHLGALAAVSAECVRASSARSLYQRVRVRHDGALLTAARNASDPLVCVSERLRPGRWASLWVAWREARARSREN
jgi:phytoene synthase